MFSSVKEKLLADLGKLGLFIFYAISLLLILTPLVICNFPWWVNVILLFVIFSTNLLGGICSVVIWVYSALIVFTQDLNPHIETLYCVFLSIYACFFLLPAVFHLFILLYSELSKAIKNLFRKKPRQPLDTWYTCPDCGQLVRAGTICDCKHIKAQRDLASAKADLETLQKVEYLHKLLSEGYCQNPYTGKPMETIDDFISYVEKITTTLKTQEQNHTDS